MKRGPLAYLMRVHPSIGTNKILFRTESIGVQSNERIAGAWHDLESLADDCPQIRQYT